MMQPTTVPRFSKTMSVEAWKKIVTNWSNTFQHIPEAARLNLIMESLKNNSERKELATFIEGLYEDPNFDLCKVGALEDFLKKIQKKFEIPGWTKCNTIWFDLLKFKKEEGETAQRYLERFEELEVKIRNQGEALSPVYLAIHFLELSDLPEITKQNILTKVDLENREKVLGQVKQAFAIMVKKMETKADENISYWSRQEDRGRRRKKERRMKRRKEEMMTGERKRMITMKEEKEEEALATSIEEDPTPNTEEEDLTLDLEMEEIRPEEPTTSTPVRSSTWRTPIQKRTSKRTLCSFQDQKIYVS